LGLVFRWLPHDCIGERERGIGLIGIDFWMGNCLLLDLSLIAFFCVKFF
jgi:hypothetical protein